MRRRRRGPSPRGTFGRGVGPRPPHDEEGEPRPLPLRRRPHELEGRGGRFKKRAAVRKILHVAFSPFCQQTQGYEATSLGSRPAPGTTPNPAASASIATDTTLSPTDPIFSCGHEGRFHSGVYTRSWSIPVSHPRANSHLWFSIALLMPDAPMSYHASNNSQKVSSVFRKLETSVSLLD